MTVTTELQEEPTPVYVWDYMRAFVAALKEQLIADEKYWGNTWRKRIRQGHEARSYAEFNNYWDQYENAGVPIPWLKIVGNAMICWIRETQEGWAIEE